MKEEQENNQTQEIALIDKKEIQTKFDAIKNEVMAVATECKTIVIATNLVNDHAVEIGANANKLLKKIDEKRKALKDPYFKAGQTIDEVSKILTKPLEEGIAIIKAKIKKFKEEEAARAAIELQKLQAQKLELESDTSDQLSKLKKAIRSITDIYNECCEIMSEGKDANVVKQNCQEVLKKILPPEEYLSYVNKVKEFRARLIDTVKSRLTSLTNKSPETNRDYVQHTLSLKSFLNEVLGDMYIEERKLVEEAQLSKTSIVSKMIETVSETTAGATRENWVFEVVKFADVPLQYLQVDEDMVKKFMKENKEGLRDGTAKISGLKFKNDPNIILK